MKKILLLCAALTLTACAPGATLPRSAPVVATALSAPHLTVSGLTVTVHNPRAIPLTGDTSRGQGPAITVDGDHIVPGPGAVCVPGKRGDGGLRYGCSVPIVTPGGTQALTFVSDGLGTAVILDTNGFGYLVGPAPVPLVWVK